MDTNQNEVKSKLYLNFLTIIFAISMVAGYERIVISTFDNISKLNIRDPVSLIQNGYIIFLPLLMCSLVLLRFFFAPVCNVKAVLEKSSIQNQSYKFKPWIIMLFDIPVLLSHSIIFYFMCQSAAKDTTLFDGWFYRFFMALLFLNAIWLITVRLRIKEKFFDLDRKNKPHLFWASNNLVAFLLLLFLPQLGWLFVLINCLVDLSFTADAYFKVSYNFPL